MQNHGGYTYTGDNYTKSISLNDYGSKFPEVEQYLSLIHETDKAVEHLRDGGAIIAHVGIPEGASIGLFTKSGHYISLISTDGKEFCILDPSYSDEKYKIPERIGRVNESNAPYLYADINTLHSETKPGRTKYHLFARKKS